MTNRGDDCYFFYYSTCTKGDSCPFRHCEAAIGSETVCTLWQEGRCFRNTCKFRHMEITHNRKEIPCYWENQATGCQKPHCAFFHEKPRYIDGVFVSPDKNVGKNVEQPQEEPASIQPPPPNSQRRETVKMDTQVPSPTHPPVVINPAEDEDEDEDEDAEISISPRKPPPSVDSLHFGVSTMEEIRLKKALKASMRRAGYPMLDENTSTSKEKENIQTMFGGDLSATSDGSLFESMDEMGGPTLMVTEHLGKKKLHSDVRHGEDAPQNHRLGERLGKIVTTEALPTPSHKDLKPVKERLGPGAAQPGEAVVEPQKAPGKIHIKTLEEIRLEKAARLKDCRSADAPETSSSKAAEREKHVPIDKVQSSGQVRTFSEVHFAKRKRKQEPDTGTQKVPGQSQPEESAAAGLGPAAPNPAGIRVKTLEEIRREKATRILSKHDCKAENNNLDAENAVKKTHLLRLSRRSLLQKSLDVTEKPLRPQAAAETLVANGDGVKVKTFEEIMQEKRLRKQELEEQAKGFAETDPLRKQTAERTLKRKVPSASPAKVPVRKLISLKSKAPASPLNRGDSQSPDSSKENPDAQSQRSVEVKQAKAAKEPEQEHPADTKVRPKLNVKPSVMKPSVQLKPAQKRRGAERSAVAAVKPLNSTSVPEQPGQEMAADTQLSSAVPCGPAVNSHSGSSPLKEELQTVPVFGQGQETPPCVPIATEACPVPQSPVQQTPPPSKTRRMSLTAPRAVSTSAMDDFEELISEFADDHLVQGEVDTDMAEDELLQELSQMIDS
ncbi:zinc finger CCCH domain-containing protein 11A isoform X2 [Takifugu rubripes]|uniref:zinc finger CCCH domain-containing protein 11A isoform X2 n=1 Tax=Takifugu rubripes TaxID=31033 RepID=UPI001145A740|nr:zinc finger CCCH domain-containing protein 11A-like isoform X2 [Takifugu rubripes]